MPDKTAKKTTRKPAQKSVLGSLPSTRPARLGRERAKPAKTAAGGAATGTRTARRKPAGTKPIVPRPERTRSARPTSPPQPVARRNGPPTGAELATTAVRAAGELAQIGITVGAQVLRRAANRLPRR